MTEFIDTVSKLHPVAQAIAACFGGVCAVILVGAIALYVISWA